MAVRPAAGLDRAAPDAILGERASAGDVARAALAASADRLDALAPRLRDALDPEVLHDARVATRRLRSHLRTFEPLFGRAWSGDLRRRLHPLADALGAARDADVLLDDARDYAANLPRAVPSDIAAALGVMRAVRDQRYAELAEFVRDPANRRLFARIDAAARAPDFRKRAAEPAPRLAAALYAPVWKDLRTRVRRAGRKPSDRELHRIRIATKNARYAADALAPVMGDAATHVAALLEELQTTLGRHHDAVNAAVAFARHAEDFAGAPLLEALAASAEARAAGLRDAWRSSWLAARRGYDRFRAHADELAR